MPSSRVLMLGLVFVAGAASADLGAAPMFQPVEVDAFPTRGYTWGGCALDIDGDGLRDLVLSEHGSRLRFYKNLGGLDFQEIGTEWKQPAGLRDHHGIAAYDYDSDGDYDFYLTVGADQGHGKGGNHLWQNEGPGQYIDISPSHLALADSIGRGRGTMWLNVDDDPQVELFVGNFRTPARLFDWNGERWVDDRNRIHTKKRRPSTATGLHRTPTAPQLPDWWLLSAGDLNGDGRVELIAPKSGRGIFLNRDGESLVEISRQLGLTVDIDGVTSAALGDVDADGDLDIAIAYKRAPGFAMWINERDDGDWKFRRVPQAASLPVDGVNQGAYLADFDNDGLCDLYVLREERQYQNAPNLMAKGLGNGSFEARMDEWGAEALVPALSHSAWPIDLDHDGDLDLICLNGRDPVHAPDRDGPMLLYENRTTAKGLVIELKSLRAGAEGLGAVVELWIDGRWLGQEMRMVGNPYSSMVAPLHFGVGDRAGPFDVRVRWHRASEMVEYVLPLAGAAYQLNEEGGAMQLQNVAKR